jgi:hypothetical protein
MKKFILTLLFALTVLCATSSYGQTLINGNNIVSFPYVISTPGSYKLTTNLNVSGAGVSAIDIETSNVTLDLGGYTIAGPVNCTSTSCNSAANTYSAGVYAYNQDVLVQNGYIKGFYTCLNLSDGTVQNLNITSCVNGIVTNYAIVRNNVVNSCNYIGIDSASSIILENVVNNNGTYGIYAYDSSVINNSSMSNQGYGLFVAEGPFTGNTLLSNSTDLYTYATTATTKNNICTSGAC